MRLRTESRREAILEVAAQVFREAGFERASMAQIAERVGGSKATLYGYFPSKEALFVAVTDSAGDRYLRAMAAEISDTAVDLEEALIRFGMRVIAFMSDDDTVASHRMVMAEAGRSDVGELFWNAGPARGQKSIADALAARMERGELKRANPVSAASHLMGLLNAEHMQRLFTRNKVPIGSELLRSTVSSAVDVFLRGYRAERPSSAAPA